MIKILLTIVTILFPSNSTLADSLFEPFKDSEIHFSACYDDLQKFEEVLNNNDDKIETIYSGPHYGHGHTIFTASIICGNYDVSNYLLRYRELIDMEAMEKKPAYYLVSNDEVINSGKSQDKHAIDAKNHLLRKISEAGFQLKIKDKIKPFEFPDDRNSIAKLAAIYGNGETLKILSDSKINLLEEKTNDNFTLLHIAAKNSNPRVLDYLVGIGIDANESSNVSKWSPLWSAVNPSPVKSSRDIEETIDKLVKLGGDLEHEALYYQYIPIYLADKCFRNETYDTLKYLLDNYPEEFKNVHKFFESPILYAGLRPYPECAKVVQLLFDKKFNLKPERHLFVVNAVIGSGNPQVLNTILKNIKLSEQNLLYSMQAAEKKNRQDMLEILEKY